MAKRRRHEEHENHERWLVSYADFITLLFAFFVVLYATSEQNVKKEEEFEKSIRKHFYGVVGFGQGGGEYPANNEMVNPIPPPLNVFPPQGSSPAEVQNYVQGRLEEEMDESAGEKAVNAVKHDAAGVRIQLAASALFPTGSANLKETALEPLAKIGELLRDSNRRILVEGHTDSSQIRSTFFPSNWELSAARATKVIRYLIQRHKIPASRLVGLAYADQKPIAPNNSEENRAKNRRIEILIVTGETAL